MRLKFEEELGMVAALKRFEGDLDDVPELQRGPVAELARFVATLPEGGRVPHPDQGELRLFADDRCYRFREFDLPEALKPALSTLRALSRPAKFT
ncbi:MAG TPA: hypothetical protein VKT78_06925 [Fimbriimonadaceae bacterium]|nr:hypothetical protein [Fimbriimonadaceae bacterium]